MSSFKNVAIAGATGYLGPAVVKAVKEAGFNVTVLLRESNSSKIEFDGVKIAKIDYGSIDSLVDALNGQDAVALVEAAVKAGVKRFLPSEYGLDVSIPSVRAVPYLRAKGLIQDLLKELGMAYTILYTGPFLEWGLDNFFVDWKTATANVWNGGDISVGMSTLADTGRAVVGVLLNPKETENKAFYTTTGMATQNEILSAAGRGMEFEVARHFLGSTIFGLEIEAGVPYGRDNDLLGIKMVTPEEFKQLVISHVKK
ncbi:hypothetical protein CI102_3492 [Trichoderma harzianum]|nr:hypothetical protein CI102_3492 [Trichoderma harzianum]